MHVRENQHDFFFHSAFFIYAEFKHHKKMKATEMQIKAFSCFYAVYAFQELGQNKT